MPTYEYSCTACGHRLDAVQKFSDDPLTECPECGGALRKVYGAVGIVLKGSGFYKTDSREAAKASNGNGKSADKDQDSKGKDKDSKDKDKDKDKSSSDSAGKASSDSSKKESSTSSAKPAASTAGSS